MPLSQDDSHHRRRVSLSFAQLPSLSVRWLNIVFSTVFIHSGFLGQRLLTAIAAASSTVSIVLTDISPPPIPAALKDSGRITAVGADLADATDLARLFGGIAVESGLAVYALHGLMSGGSEADFELGYRGAFPRLLAGLLPRASSSRLTCCRSCAVPS